MWHFPHWPWYHPLTNIRLWIKALVWYGSLELLLELLSTRIYDTRDDFKFEIINFPHMDSNIPSSPAYGVYISQLIRYARGCSKYSEFAKRHQILTKRLLNQGFVRSRLENSFKKFYGRYQDQVEKYSVSCSEMIKVVLITFKYLLFSYITLLFGLSFDFPVLCCLLDYTGFYYNLFGSLIQNYRCCHISGRFGRL